MTTFNDVAQFDQSEVSNALIDFVPARVYAVGVKATDKRITIATNASVSASQFLISQGGKVGKAAAMKIVADGIAGITKAARNGNYKPLAESLACINAESVCITSRASFDSLTDGYGARLADIQAGKNEGLTSSGKQGGKLKAVTQSLMLINAVYDGIAAMVAQENDNA
jgi:hypothetical protein